MRPLLASALLALAAIGAGGAGGVIAQTTREQAREAGKQLGTQKRADGSLGPSDAKASSVPGYGGTELPEQTFYDNPEGLKPAGQAQAASSDTYATVVDKGHTRAGFTEQEILATTQRATTIEKNPDPYTGGTAMSGADGSCQQLPPSTDPRGSYEETCNSGLKIVDRNESCSAHVDTTVVNDARYTYWGTSGRSLQLGFAADDNVMRSKVDQGICRPEGAPVQTCQAALDSGLGGNQPRKWYFYCLLHPFGRSTSQLYSCRSEIPAGEIPGSRNWKNGTPYYSKEGSTSVVTRRNEGTCPAMASDQACQATGPEVCTQGPGTRVIEGVQVYQSCWAWSRPFLCHRTTPANDCSALEARPECHHVRDECLDDPQDGPCKVSQPVYSCPLNDTTKPVKQYLCGGDVYCLNGNCETVDREASTEFKDALVALHTMGDAGKQFDPNNLTVLSGERNTCHKKIFGAANCCAGKGVPLLTPALCDKAEKRLKEKQDKGLCHEVGTYCADKVLGVCVTSKKAYCCFGSKLSRILQEQGRNQIGKPWGKPKHATCEGFTIAEFQRLDLSRMDFSEVYAEFQDAAKLPDEVGTMNDIQSKIQAYYDHAKQRGK